MGVSGTWLAFYLSLLVGATYAISRYLSIDLGGVLQVFRYELHYILFVFVYLALRYVDGIKSLGICILYFIQSATLVYQLLAHSQALLIGISNIFWIRDYRFRSAGCWAFEL